MSVSVAPGVTSSPHAVGLSPVVTAVTEAAPGAGVSLGVRGGPGGGLAPGLQRPVLLPRVHPVPDTADHHGVTTWLLTCNTPSPGSDSRDTRPSPGWGGPRSPDPPWARPSRHWGPAIIRDQRLSEVTCVTNQVKQVIVPALLSVNAPARGGCAAQNKLAQSRSLINTLVFINDCDDDEWCWPGRSPPCLQTRGWGSHSRTSCRYRPGRPPPEPARPQQLQQSERTRKSWHKHYLLTQMWSKKSHLNILGD